MGLIVCYSNQINIFNIYRSRAHLLCKCHTTLTEIWRGMKISLAIVLSCLLFSFEWKLLGIFSEKIMFWTYCTGRRHLRLIKKGIYIRKASGQFSVALWATSHLHLINSQWRLVTKYHSWVPKYHLIDRVMN